MAELDRTFEAILAHKASQMIEGARKGAFGTHLRELLTQLGITRLDDSLKFFHIPTRHFLRLYLKEMIANG